MRILFLGYPECQILDFLKQKYDVFQTEKHLKYRFVDAFDLLVSFGYRFLLPSEILDRLPRPPMNLHISYLPWNRGADPNFWSFWDNTPKGVSIHLIDEGIDTGDILFQREVEFAEEEDDLASTYQRLMDEVQELFIDMWNLLQDNSVCQVIRTPQPEGGSYHSVHDRPFELSQGWKTKVHALGVPE